MWVIQSLENILSNPKIIQTYSELGQFMKNYRSGKIPQPLHILPKIDQWEKVLQLTKPEEWSRQAIFTATKLLSSSLDTDQSELFYRTVLLPACRKCIRDEKKLDYHLYRALVKALYKP